MISPTIFLGRGKESCKQTVKSKKRKGERNWFASLWEMPPCRDHDQYPIDTLLTYVQITASIKTTPSKTHLFFSQHSGYNSVCSQIMTQVWLVCQKFDIIFFFFCHKTFMSVNYTKYNTKKIGRVYFIHKNLSSN